MKYRRLIAAVLLPLTLLVSTGCSSATLVPVEDLRPVQGDELEPGEDATEAEAVLGLVTLSGEKVRFDDWVVPVGDTLHATVGGEPYTVALDQVDQVVVRRGVSTAGKVVVIVLFLAAVATAAALAAFSQSTLIF
jgi:hypothetical protein